jgi:hypothetical protein
MVQPSGQPWLCRIWPVSRVQVTRLHHRHSACCGRVFKCQQLYRCTHMPSVRLPCMYRIRLSQCWLTHVGRCMVDHWNHPGELQTTVHEAISKSSQVFQQYQTGLNAACHKPAVTCISTTLAVHSICRMTPGYPLDQVV